MASKIFKISGIVIDKRDRGDKDVIYTVLTPQDMKVEVLAKHAKKVPSRHNSGLELFNGVSCQLYQGRILPVVNQSKQTFGFPHVVSDYRKLQQGFVILVLLKMLIAMHQPIHNVYHLLYKSLTLLDTVDNEQNNVIAIMFRIKLLYMTGLFRSSSQCQECNSPFSSQVYFAQYRYLCSNCCFRPDFIFEVATNDALVYLSKNTFETVLTSEYAFNGSHIENTLYQFMQLQIPQKYHALKW